MVALIDPLKEPVKGALVATLVTKAHDPLTTSDRVCGRGVQGLGAKAYGFKGVGGLASFLSSPITIRVPFFLLLGFNKGTRK